MRNSIRFLISIVTIIALSFTQFTSKVHASERKSPVMVSLGDSFSSGEGIEPFYGQYDDQNDPVDIHQKVKNQDWLAHRSTLAWSGQLVLPGNTSPMSSYKDESWFFVASSGAVSSNICNLNDDEKPGDRHYNTETNHSMHEQLKEFNKGSGDLKGEKYIRSQLTVFDTLQLLGLKADYVTLSLGGNDVKFTDVVTKVVASMDYFDKSKLSNMINNLWIEFYEWHTVEDKFEVEPIRDSIYRSYHCIEDCSGEQAIILVAGYPMLLNEADCFVVSETEAIVVNQAVHNFNLAIKHIVNQSADEGMNIHFVDVEEGFKGHQAYSDKPYIHSVYLLERKSEDLTKLNFKDVASSYSMHPTKYGAEVYAECVQNKIDELSGRESDYNNQNLDIQEVPTDLIVKVINEDGSYCENSKLIITGTQSTLFGLSKKSYRDTLTVESGKMEITLPVGEYNLTVTDGNSYFSERIKTKKTNKRKYDLVFLTDFSSDKQKEEQTSLEVLKKLDNKTFMKWGNGNWSISVTINKDGSFTGHYSDVDMGVNSDDYPNGTVWYSDFTGKFINWKKIDEYTYNMNFSNIVLEKQIDSSYIENGMRYYFVEPMSFDSRSDTEYELYLPGKDISDLSEETKNYLLGYLSNDDRKLNYYMLIHKESGFPIIEFNDY